MIFLYIYSPYNDSTMTDVLEELEQDSSTDRKIWNSEFLLGMTRQALNSGDKDAAIRYYQSVRKILPENNNLQAEFEVLSRELKDYLNGNGNENHSNEKKSVKNSGNMEKVQEEQLHKNPNKNSNGKKFRHPKTLGRLTAMFHKQFCTVPDLKRPITGTDLIALRALKVSTHKHILLIMPIKVSEKIDNGLIIGESTIKLFMNPTAESKARLEQIQKEVKVLSYAHLRIIENFALKGELFTVACHYLGGEYSLELLKDKETVYFHDGLTEYRTIFAPIYISQDRVAFAEKILPFPYQRASNIHFLNVSQIPQFLSFLERKAVNKVKYSEVGNTIEKKGDLYNEFLTRIQYASLTFLPISVILLILTLIFMYQFFIPFLGLDLASLIAYGLILGYLCGKYAQKKENLQAPSNISKQDHTSTIDETDLELMSSEFTEEEMDQLLYEFFGKEANINSAHFNTKPTPSEEPKQQQEAQRSSPDQEDSTPTPESKIDQEESDPLVNKYSDMINK